MKVQLGTVLTAYVGAEMLDKVLATCNYEASGDGVVLVDTDQLDNTSDETGQVKEMAENIQAEAHDEARVLNLEETETNRETFHGLILLRN